MKRILIILLLAGFAPEAEVYYVNSYTGEKSGVMLVDVTWTVGE